MQENRREKSRSGSVFQRTHRLVVCCNDAGNKIHIHNFNLRGMYNTEAVDVGRFHPAVGHKGP
jgi:hypothetical protein